MRSVRPAILALLAVAPAFAVCPSGPTGYGYCRSITLLHGQVGSTQTNFTNLVCFNSTAGSLCDGANSNTSIPNLKTVANGGQIKSTGTTTYPYSHTIAFDVLFTNSTGTALNFECERYSASTGEYIGWVKIPSLSSSVDTVIYIFYSKASDTDHTSNAAWGAEWLAVYHAGDGTSIQASDSTSGANTGTLTAVSATAGDIDGGGSFNGTSSQWGTNATINTGLINISTTDMTTFILANPTSTSGTPVFVSQNNGASGTGRTWMELSSAKLTSVISGSSTTGATTITTSTWFILGVTYDHTGHVVTVWVNGASDGTGTHTAESATGSNMFGVSKAGSAFYSGIMDEMRISNTLHDANWFTTLKNNFVPNSFYTLGAEQSASGLNGFAIIALALYRSGHILIGIIER